MLFSIITAAKNSEKTIHKTIESVKNQRNVRVEHIVKDAISDDNTIKIAKSYNPDVKVISKCDRGVYDGMNQGFEHATGDIVAFLNSDDQYAHCDILSEIEKEFSNSNCDLVYGNIKIINSNGRIIRHWKTGNVDASNFKSKQIPHPALFIRRSTLEKLKPTFDPNLKISSDLKQQLLLFNNLRVQGAYYPHTTTLMLHGGESTNSMNAYITGWIESRKSYNDVFKNGGTIFVIKKVLRKTLQFSRK
ncbi:glycosyltransferase family 2 protein [Pelagicoccus mobilis]|uniref:Glycosyltransferase n=1 Tax=Pelagicoccus mobilis TaxID=415221 RepID=A0A934VJJ1_9BACT|nr:glycosyltransferase family 2 protein [Pelagicoccus mobilis]MBK1875676.1 glycosyltransferase [Pelagicoccus mobilis]